MKLPRLFCYCSNTTGQNAMAVEVGNLTVYFSYKTPVAYCDGNGLVCRENDWGPTTGKHLNAITDKFNRIPGEQFEDRLREALARAKA